MARPNHQTAFQPAAYDPEESSQHTILTCGGRSYGNRNRVFETLDNLKPSLVVHGGEPGADQLTRAFAQATGTPVRVFAPSRNDDRRAMLARNTRMLTECAPDLLVAFPGGDRTKDMISKAQRAGCTIIRIPDLP